MIDVITELRCNVGRCNACSCDSVHVKEIIMYQEGSKSSVSFRLCPDCAKVLKGKL
jgi:hypothetical protein